MNDNTKRMSVVVGVRNFLGNDYVTFTSDYEYGVDYLDSILNQAMNSVINGVSLGRAYRMAYDSFVAALEPEYKHIKKVPPGSFRIYGPPETTLKDLIEEGKVEIDSKQVENYLIEIPKGKFETYFILKNVGKIDVNYSFDKNNEIEIDPISGNIPVSQEQKINLKVLNSKSINLQSNEDINTTLKLRTTKIYFKSNAGDKEITIKYWGI